LISVKAGMPAFFFMWWEVIILFATGCLGGLLSGLLGIGGGVIYVVVFQTWLEYHTGQDILPHEFVQLIILNSLVAIIFSAMAGLWGQSRNLALDGAMITKSGLPAAISAIVFTIAISSGNWYQREPFLIVFTLLLLPLLLKLIPKKSDITVNTVKDRWLFSGGALAGMATALSGLGGGVVLHPYLHGLAKLDMRKTLPLSLGVMLFSAGSIVAFHLLLGNLESGYKGIIAAMVIPVALGNILTAPLGVRLAQRLPIMTIKWVFIIAALLLFSRNLYLIFS
jgi:uncharacterized protein